jgi:outer membrane protein OmpA-like peptidoglycan-associated protein
MRNSDLAKLITRKANEPPGSNEASNKQKSIPWGMIFVALILLSVLAGYFIYTLKSERTSRWAMEDIAPKKSAQILEKGKKTPEIDTRKEKIDLNDKLAEEISPQDAGVAEQVAAVAQQDAPVAETEITGSQNKDEDPSARPSETIDASKMLKQKTVIHFDSNSNELKDEAYEKLDEIARFMTKSPNSEIIIEGYTDARGNWSYNQRLSEFRANMVKNYLVAKGIDPAKIEAIGLGAQNFIASNDTEENRILNRRVEIKVNTK